MQKPSTQSRTIAARTALIALALAAGLSTAFAQNGGGSATTAAPGDPAAATPDAATAPAAHKGSAMDMLKRSSPPQPMAAANAPTMPLAPGKPLPDAATLAARLDKRMASMTEKLKLTPDQQTKVKAVLQDENTRILAANTKFQKAQGAGAARGDRQMEIQAAREATEAKLAKILTPAQQQQMGSSEEKGMDRYAADALKRMRPATAQPATKPAS